MTALSLILSTAWLGVFAMLSKDWPDGRWRALVGAVASCMAVALAASNIWPRMLDGYPGDSYWTLRWFGRIGVAVISAAGLAVLFLALRWKTRVLIRRVPVRLPCLLIDLVCGLLMFGVLYSVAPQIFYSFYRLIIPGLPVQWVINGPFDIARLLVAAHLETDGRLSDHIAGITLWAIIPFTVWLHLRHQMHREV